MPPPALRLGFLGVLAAFAALAPVLAARDEFVLRGSLLCRLNYAATVASVARIEYAGSRAPPMPDTARFAPWQNITALRARGDQAVCVPDRSCGPNTQPLYRTIVDSSPAAFHVWCGCAARFFRRAPGALCERCADTEVCPEHAVQRFRCPAPLRVEDSECVGVPGWRADPNPDVLRLGLLVFHEQPHLVDYSRASRIVPCPEFMAAAAGACECMRGYFGGPHGSCAPCPRGHFCAGGTSTPCPSPTTTLYEAAGGVADCLAVAAPLPRVASVPVGFYVDRHGGALACGAGATTLYAGAAHAGACYCRGERRWRALPASREGFTCAVPPGASLRASALRVVHAPTELVAVFAGVAAGVVWEAPPPAEAELARHGNSTLLVLVLSMHAGGLALTAHFADPLRTHRQVQSPVASPLGLPDGLVPVTLLAAWSAAESGYDIVLVLASSTATALWRVDCVLAYDVSAHALRFKNTPTAHRLREPSEAAVFAVAPLRAASVLLVVAVQRERVFEDGLLLVPASEPDLNASTNPLLSNANNLPMAPVVLEAFNVTVQVEAPARFHTVMACLGAGRAVPRSPSPRIMTTIERPTTPPVVTLWDGAVCANVSLQGGAVVTVHLDTCAPVASGAAAKCWAHDPASAWMQPPPVLLAHDAHTYRATSLAVHLWRSHRTDFVLAWHTRGPLGGLVLLLPEREHANETQRQRAQGAALLVQCAALPRGCVPAAGALQRAVQAVCAPGFVKMGGGGCMQCLSPMNASSGCRLCEPPFFCSDGREHSCPSGSSSRYYGAVGVLACVCDEGSYSSPEGPCAPCERGFYCTQGARVACAAHATTPGGGAAVAGQCACINGFSARGADCVPEPCAEPMARVAGGCVCPAGLYMRSNGTCVPCATDALCPAGSRAEGAVCRADLLHAISRSRARCVCRAGYYSRSDGGGAECKPCPAGFWCDAPREMPLVACPPGESSAPSTPSAEGCFCVLGGFLKRRLPGGGHDCVCDAAFYRNHTACEPCPAYSRASAVGAVRAAECVCLGGFFAREGGVCAPCPRGHFCSAGLRTACPAGTFGPARRQRSESACIPCRGGGAAAAETASACAREVLPLRIGEAFGAYADRVPHAEHTWARVRFASGNVAPLGAARVGELQARFTGFTGGRGALQVLSVEEGSRDTTVAVQSTESALADILTALADDPEAWGDIKSGAASHRLDTHAVLTHAIFCELAAAVVRAAFAPGSMSVECATSGLVLPGALQRASMLALARATVVRVFNTNTAALPPTLLGAAVGSSVVWDMHPLLREILRVSAANLHTSAESRVRAWGSSDELRNEVLLLDVEEARGMLLLLPCNASGFARGNPTLGADYMQVFGDLAPAACEAAVLWAGGSCAHAAPQQPQRAVCRFCPAGVAFMRGGECVPCSRGLQCPVTAPGEAGLELHACCGTEDATCRPAAPVALAAVARMQCRNGVHDLGEACDPTSGTPLAACCTRTCTLQSGFYAEPPCMTYCGDGIIAAPAEQCEPAAGTQNCSLLTCRFE